ncbi:SHOCT domain-containing protein [candidate division KSB1 bacterium]
MTPIRDNSSDGIFIPVIILLVIDLLTDGSIDWSVWPVGILICVYFLSLTGRGRRGSREMTILKERFAKGDISEEEFLQQKEQINNDFISAGSAGFNYSAGVIIIIIGMILLIRNYMYIDIPWFSILLISAGLYSILRRFR